MVCIVSRFTRIYGTQIKKTNNILNKNIDTNIKVMFGNRFCFLFFKTCFWDYKEKNNFFFGIFEIKNMFG